MLSPLEVSFGGSSAAKGDADEREIFPEAEVPMQASAEAFHGRTPADEFFQAATIGLGALAAAALGLGAVAASRAISLRRNPEADFIYDSSSK